MINRITHIGLFMLLSTIGVAQYDMSVIGNCIEAYFETISHEKYEVRTAGMDTLVVANAHMTSIILQENRGSSITAGTWREYLSDSKPFYGEYSLEFSELEREVDYYLDIASVHILVEQLSTNKETKRQFTQRLWLQLELIFMENRWFITDALWINEANRPIEEAMLQDTLLRVP